MAEFFKTQKPPPTENTRNPIKL